MDFFLDAYKHGQNSWVKNHQKVPTSARIELTGNNDSHNRLEHRQTMPLHLSTTIDPSRTNPVLGSTRSNSL
eukprot:scaffold19245_cov199-Amphora_coffeaeformis.AAC.35